jgi:tetratricopeptide (TPR) repeat protein
LVMRRHIIFAAIFLLSGLLGSSVAVRAQDAASQSAPPDAPTPSTSTSQDKTPDKGKDKSKPAATPKGTADQTAAPDSPLPAAKKPSTAEDNPFPEEESEKAAKAAKAADAAPPDTPAPTSTTSPDKGSSSLDNMDKLGLNDDAGRRQLKLESPDGSTTVYDPKRATDDVKVGKFYMQTGFYKGAYERFKDATVFDHENVDAVFYLAEAAQKLNMAKEAQQNYQLYLAAVPDGPNAKNARKALGELPKP